jgi:Family of unknown function (DUF6690)
MASRPLIIASLLGASVGVPYIASQTQRSQSVTNNSPPASSAVNAQPAATLKTAAAPVAIGQPLAGPAAVVTPSATPPLDGAQFTSAAQVLRFDVTKEWVCRNWSRKSTGPTDVGLFSIRVPLVMGTQMSALAGALTYYFNAQGQVEHISFLGRTGDTTPLVQLLNQSYQFQPVAAPTGEKVYQVADGDAVFSELRLKPEAVLRSNAPQQSIAVELEFARPGSRRVLPPHAPPLQVPQVAASPEAGAAKTPENSSSESVGGTVKSAVGNYFNQVRYATPEEESELFRRRWPQ